MDVDADVAVLVLDAQRLAGVDADPHPQGPLFERRLCLCGGCDCTLGLLEDGEEGVAFGPELDPLMCREGAAEDPAMLSQELIEALVPELLEQARRALDVGEEDGDNAARELPHCTHILARPSRCG
jgi:hypothetical protein